MDKKIFYELAHKYVKGTATDEEKQLVETYYEELSNEDFELAPDKKQLLQEQLYDSIQKAMHQPAKVVPIKFNWKRVAAAAAVLLFLSTSSYYLFFNNPGNQTAIATNQPVIKDLPPGRNAAILTLANGNQIILDSTQGTISNQAGITVINLNGLLTYEATKGNKNTNLAYNTITTARGNQYQLILSDGTKVWLNSASSLRYPAMFSETKREVELAGEGYFEVAKNASKPFNVSIINAQSGKMNVEVLGTHFNINSYMDEAETKTTLLEGLIKLNYLKDQEKKHQLLKPGEQGIINGSGIRVSKEVDLEKVMAWKRGLFEFSNTDLPTIMRQISRWYNVDVVFEGEPTHRKYGGGINKNLPLSKVLHMLEGNDVKFKLEGKMLKVTK